MVKNIRAEFEFVRHYQNLVDKGWHFQEEIDVVRVFYPPVVNERLNLNPNSSHVAGDSLKAAIDWVMGFENAMTLVKINGMF